VFKLNLTWLINFDTLNDLATQFKDVFCNQTGDIFFIFLNLVILFRKGSFHTYVFLILTYEMPIHINKYQLLIAHPFVNKPNKNLKRDHWLNRNL